MDDYIPWDEQTDQGKLQMGAQEHKCLIVFSHPNLTI
jgi:hypothetical protein